ncbi:MAG: hypothetical protein LBT05_16950, partial [Planctomycetaceae bacterium]|nr:hypothetical protein [Planctomycetaceae bacterium]
KIPLRWRGDWRCNRPTGWFEKVKSEKLRAKSFASGIFSSGIETIVCPTLKILREIFAILCFFVVKGENGMIKNIFLNF